MVKNYLFYWHSGGTPIDPAVFGYIRVSQVEGESGLATQRRTLNDHGLRDDRIFTDVASGKNMRRPSWRTLREMLNPGDTVVLFPHARAAYASGAFAPKSWSSTAYASSPDQWIEVLEKIKALDVDTYLPGHAHLVTDRAEIDEEIVFLRERKVAVEDAIARGLNADQAAEALTFEQYEDWRGSARRERNIRNLHYLLSTGRPIYFDYLEGRTATRPY